MAESIPIYRQFYNLHGVQINACAFVTFTASDVTSNRIKIEQFKKIYTTSDISNCTRLKAGVILREFPDIPVV